MVFSNEEVVRRINSDFIPVALKAALVNNPPAGVEGDLYAEISRTKPAPQGICTVNSAGKVLSWALSFDSDEDILGFLDHVGDRYRQFPDAARPVTALRFMRYPGHELDAVPDTGRALPVPDRHVAGERCIGQPELRPGTLVGRVIGRALDDNGQPVSDITRQEHYMEARLEIAAELQGQLVDAVSAADGAKFAVPTEVARAIVMPAFLGQLDVNPLGGVPGSRNDVNFLEFFGEEVTAGRDADVRRIRITGRSHVAGGHELGPGPRSDGRFWSHAVSLDWQGYVDLSGERIAQLDMLAHGHERLQWGNSRMLLQAQNEPDAAHLMAGHPIDLDCGVRYGLHARPIDDQ